MRMKFYSGELCLLAQWETYRALCRQIGSRCELDMEIGHPFI